MMAHLLQHLRRWWTQRRLRREHAAILRQIARAHEDLQADHDHLGSLLARRFAVRQRLLATGALRAFLTPHSPSAQAAVVHALRRPPGFEATEPSTEPAPAAGRPPKHLEH